MIYNIYMHFLIRKVLRENISEQSIIFPLNNLLFCMKRPTFENQYIKDKVALAYFKFRVHRIFHLSRLLELKLRLARRSFVKPILLLVKVFTRILSHTYALL